MSRMVGLSAGGRRRRSSSAPVAVTSNNVVPRPGMSREPCTQEAHVRGPKPCLCAAVANRTRSASSCEIFWKSAREPRAGISNHFPTSTHEGRGKATLWGQFAGAVGSPGIVGPSDLAAGGVRFCRGWAGVRPRKRGRNDERAGYMKMAGKRCHAWAVGSHTGLGGTPRRASGSLMPGPGRWAHEAGLGGKHKDACGPGRRRRRRLRRPSPRPTPAPPLALPAAVALAPPLDGTGSPPRTQGRVCPVPTGGPASAGMRCPGTYTEATTLKRGIHGRHPYAPRKHHVTGHECPARAPCPNPACTPFHAAMGGGLT